MRWIEPTVEEDQKVQTYVGAAISTRADPDYAEPPEAHYAENGIRYLQAINFKDQGRTVSIAAE